MKKLAFTKNHGNHALPTIKMPRVVFLIAILLVTLQSTSLLLMGCKNEENFEAVYLTYSSEDTATAITVNFITDSKNIESTVYYDIESKSSASTHRFRVAGDHVVIDGVDRNYHRVQISNLNPATMYYFSIKGSNKEYQFKTLSADDTPIRIVQGGDMDVDPIFVQVSAAAMKQNPDVILIGGDIAYANGNIANLDRWDRWMKSMSLVSTTATGQLIPLIVAIGNHETNGLTKDPLKNAPFYFSIFAQNEALSYFLRKLGQHSVLLVLDTGHAHSQSGEQVRWLRESLATHANTPNKLAMYHVPLYPSHRDFDNSNSVESRKQWLPLFDHFGLTLAFENHDHTLKRTKMLKNNEVVESAGTIYVGDGCWGKAHRASSPRWYLEKGLDQRHVWSAILQPSDIELEASGLEGQVFDHFKIHTRGPTQIENLGN